MSNVSDTSDTSPVTPQGDAVGPGASDASLRLDGNAAAGVLAEVFGTDMTGAQSTCAHCEGLDHSAARCCTAA